MTHLYIDGENAVLGRLGSYVAKQLLKGDEVTVVNSEKVLISGTRKDIVSKINYTRTLGGSSQKGPKISRLPEMMLKRKIRGMLPRDNAKGRTALAKLRCEAGNPLSEEDSKKLIKLNHKLPAKFIKLERVVELL